MCKGKHKFQRTTGKREDQRQKEREHFVVAGFGCFWRTWFAITGLGGCEQESEEKIWESKEIIDEKI